MNSTINKLQRLLSLHKKCVTLSRSLNQNALLKSDDNGLKERSQEIEIRNNRTGLELIRKSNGTSLKFNSLWLRFNCHSSASKQPDSGQRIIDTESVPLDLTIENVKLQGDQLIIEWNGASKQPNSVLPINFLINNYPSNVVASESTRHKYKKMEVSFAFFQSLFQIFEKNIHINFFLQEFNRVRFQSFFR